MKKLLDEKGKIFGFINIVDLIVLLIIISIIGVIAVRIVSPKRNAEGTSILNGKREVYATLYVQNAVPEALECLNVGDKMVANSAFTTAEIVSIESRPAAYVTTDSDGKPHLEEHPQWVDLIVVVKDTVDISSPILKIGEQEARTNYPIILKTQQFEASAKILTLEFKEIGEDIEYTLDTEDVSDTEDISEVDLQTEQTSLE